MGFDDLCVLGLGFQSSAGEYKPSKPAVVFGTTFEPELTLRLSDLIPASDNKLGGINDPDLCRQDSGASSFSNASVKREREVRSEETEMERVSSRVSEEDDDGSNGRKKLRLTKAQSALLEQSFNQHITLNPKQKQELARDLKLRPRQVEVWFQNRRARTKLKQTEVDCEYLKKCCETLTDENRRLQQELADLKAMKLAQPLYMQLPAATLSMCPSCQRIGGGAAPENAAKNSFVMAPKPHFFNPFSNQPTAC